MIKKDKYFNTSLNISIAIHLIAIVFLYLGLPNFFEPLPDQHQTITFEMLPPSAINNVQDLEKHKKSEEKKKEAKKIKQSHTPQEKSPQEEEKKNEDVKQEAPEVKKPLEKKTVEKKPEVAKEKPQETIKKENPKSPALKKEEVIKKEETKSVKKAPSSKKEDITKKAEAKSVKKENTKTQENKKNVKKQVDPLDTLLKNLEEASEGESKKSPFKAIDARYLDDSKFSRGQIYDENSPLSVTENLIIKRQLEENWQPPIGIEHIRDVRVLLHMKLNIDGSVQELEIRNIICPTLVISNCRLVAESAIRAVKKANPLESLMPDRYDSWKEFDVYFDPSSFSE